MTWLPMKNHYEILNLERNCSSKDIKEAFLKLSKKYHPDKNKSTEAHKKFVEVNEAYSVLGKSGSRTKYDESLSHSVRHSGVKYHNVPTSSTEDYYEFHGYRYTQNFKKNFENGGSVSSSIKRRALLFCCFLMAIGTGFRIMVVYRELKQREARSNKISVALNEVRERSQQLGRLQAILEFEKAVVNSKAGKNEKDN